MAAAARWIPRSQGSVDRMDSARVAERRPFSYTHGMAQRDGIPAWPALPTSIATALKALIFVRGRPGELVPIREIAAATGISRPYLGKILHFLSRADLIRSKRGHGGGVTLARDPATISVFDVIVAVEGDNWKVGCLLHPNTPKEQLHCSVQGIWSDLRCLIEERLRSVTLDSLPSAPAVGNPGDPTEAPDPSEESERP